MPYPELLPDDKPLHLFVGRHVHLLRQRHLYAAVLLQEGVSERENYQKNPRDEEVQPHERAVLGDLGVALR